jgi:O-antigen ligase
MSKALIRKIDTRRPKSTASLADLFAIPVLACAYAVILSPLLIFFTRTASTVLGVMETRNENKLVWPAMAALALAFAARNYSRRGGIVWPPHMIAFLAYLGFAGASVLWAYAPEISFIRYAQQLMVVTAVVLPAVLADRRTDLTHGLFLCFGLAVLINVPFVMQGYQSKLVEGYQGYFPTKNQLGACAAIALLLSFHEVLYSGRRRMIGIFIGAVSVALILLSSSKTALGLCLLAPTLAAVALTLRRAMRVSPLLLPAALVLGYFALSAISGFSMSRLSYMLYGDPSFTGRQAIWDFASYEISRRPLLGWGYQCFWLVGPGAPSVVDAPGWLKTMPNAHNGYYDSLLEMGYVGFALLLTFLAATIHAIGRVAQSDPRRAWLLFSLAFFVMITNGLETTWMRGFEVLWVVFLIVAAETARFWQPAYGGPPRHARPPDPRNGRPRRIGRPRPGRAMGRSPAEA